MFLWMFPLESDHPRVLPFPTSQTWALELGEEGSESRISSQNHGPGGQQSHKPFKIIQNTLPFFMLLS